MHYLLENWIEFLLNAIPYWEKVFEENKNQSNALQVPKFRFSKAKLSEYGPQLAPALEQFKQVEEAFEKAHLYRVQIHVQKFDAGESDKRVEGKGLEVARKAARLCDSGYTGIGKTYPFLIIPEIVSGAFMLKRLGSFTLKKLVPSVAKRLRIPGIRPRLVVPKPTRPVRIGPTGPAPGGTGRARLFEKASEVGSSALPAGAGRTDKFGNVVYSTLGSADDVALARFHESVHSALSPKFKLFRELRADIGMAAYKRSSFLRYLEEALAESYAQLRVRGIKGLPTGIAFPIKEGYVALRAVCGRRSNWDHCRRWGDLRRVSCGKRVRSILMNEDELLSLAKQIAMEKEWPWLPPVQIKRKRRLLGNPYWTILTNCEGRGANVYIEIDDSTQKNDQGGFSQAIAEASLLDCG